MTSGLTYESIVADNAGNFPVGGGAPTAINPPAAVTDNQYITTSNGKQVFPIN